jgi:hypothetical protein
MIPPLPNEADRLRAMLGIGPTVLIDIKPPDLLTDGEIHTAHVDLMKKLSQKYAASPATK